MNKSEMRVALAKDVLDQLEKGKILASGCCYLLPAYSEEGEASGEASEDLSLRTVLQKQSACGVCAVGSLFLEYARRGKARQEDLDKEANEADFHDTLLKIFSSRQLFLIETAYEASANVSPLSDAGIPKTLVRRAESCYHNRERPDRLRLIMKNIVRNGGHFKVPQRDNLGV